MVGNGVFEVSSLEYRDDLPSHSVLYTESLNHQISTSHCWSSDQSHRLDTCFAWLGHGSFVTKETVLSYLDLLSSHALPADTLALADNFFTTSLNRAPLVVVTPAIASLPSLASGFSDGHDGLNRNRIYIVRFSFPVMLLNRICPLSSTGSVR